MIKTAKTMNRKNNRGITLIELLIALAIVGILAAIAFPSFQSQALAANRTDGINTLLTLQGQMERHFFDNNSYPNGLSGLAAYANDTITSADGHYTVAMNITATCPINTCFELVATAIGGQVDDGNLQLFSNGSRLPAEKW